MAINILKYIKFGVLGGAINVLFANIGSSLSGTPLIGFHIGSLIVGFGLVAISVLLADTILKKYIK